MTPAHHRHPAQRQLVGVIVAIDERESKTATQSEEDFRRNAPRPREYVCQVSIYPSRQSGPLSATVPLTFPKAGAYQPSVGDRFQIIVTPAEA